MMLGEPQHLHAELVAELTLAQRLVDDLAVLVGIHRGRKHEVAESHRSSFPCCGLFRSYGRAGGPSPVSSLALRKRRSEEHTSELQSLMRISSAVFCLKKKQYENKYIHKNARKE